MNTEQVRIAFLENKVQVLEECVKVLIEHASMADVDRFDCTHKLEMTDYYNPEVEK